jgi:hypothetical protein
VLFRSRYHYNERTAKENAILIALAPRMLEALRATADLAEEAIAWRADSLDPDDKEEGLMVAYRADVEKARAILEEVDHG